ncbi:MAG: sulfite exporter TauE/SafE family protein, partial [Candidatus Omnitrophica bacterium]|nr:sulfite exporter TauE/SafE family protein [Candidatus Omnitrophota bacterium]
MKKTTFNIAGMHCVSCEVLLEKELKKISGVEKCHISHKKGFAELECEDEVTENEIKNKIEGLGYKVIQKGEKHFSIRKRNTKKDLLEVAFISLGIIFIFLLLQKVDFFRILPDYGKRVNTLIAFIMGIAASVSTCLALVGGIVMGFGSMYPIHEDKKHKLISRAMPHIYFHVGRVIGFLLLGGILGVVGSKLNYSLSFTGYLTMVIGIVMFYIGLQILNIVPNISRFGFHLPKALSKKIHSVEKNDHHLMPVVLGVLTFFLPCGFTQSMQLAAVASGSFFSGASIMAAFAIGTMPVLFSVGVGSTYAKSKHIGFVSKIIGVLIIFFALYSFNSGLVLSGAKFNLNFNSSKGAVDAVVSTDVSGADVQVVKMDVDWVFKPTEFRVKKGVKVRWEINGINVSGCSNEVVIPSLNIRKQIETGLN